MSKPSKRPGGPKTALTLATSLLAFGFAGSAIAQNYAFSNVQISGNKRIEAPTILTYAGISRGQSLSAAELNDAAQKIRATGLFESVELTPRGGTLSIAVEERPTISRINFEGNRRLADERLGTLVSSQPRRVYSAAQAEADTAAIANAYAETGRINATVIPKIIRRSDNRVDLVFEINESGITEIEKIAFVGNRNFSERRLRGVLETKQAGILRQLIKRDTYAPGRVEFDKQVLTDFYRSRGYVDFAIQNVDVSLTRERNAYLVTFNVQEGQQFRIGSVDVVSEVAGANPQNFTRLVKLDRGEVYSPSRIDSDIARIEVAAAKAGLNFVRVEPVISRNPRDLTLDVTYKMVTGPKIFVERIDIEGNTTTLDRVVRTQFRTVEGDPFNPRAIRQSAERVRALGYFGNADVEAREGSSPDQVVIDVDVSEQPTGSLTFGANYSTDSGVGLLANFKERNFLGRGQQLSFGLNLSKKNRLASFDFTEPNLLGRDVAFNLSANYTTSERAYALYDTVQGQLRPSLTFPLNETVRLSVFYDLRFAEIRNVAANASGIIQREAAEGGRTTHALGYGLSYDSRRSGFESSSAVVLRFAQEYGVGDDVRFIKTTASASAQTLVFNEDITLRATVEGGMLNYLEGSSRVTDRFYMGSRTMRGFEPGGIGPRDAVTDDALGGNAFAVARLEAEFPLGLPEEYGISGGAFVDYGALWDVGNTAGATGGVIYNDADPRTIAGLSVFWTTPIGPLRFNFTQDLDVKDRDKTKNFDVTISTQF